MSSILLLLLNSPYLGSASTAAGWAEFTQNEVSRLTQFAPLTKAKRAVELFFDIFWINYTRIIKNNRVAYATEGSTSSCMSTNKNYDDDVRPPSQEPRNALKWSNFLITYLHV